jgi:spore cortex protein
MNKAIKAIATVSLIAVTASSVVACNPNTSRTQSYQANEYRTNYTAPRYHDGVLPYGVRPYSVAPYGVHPYSARPYGAPSDGNMYSNRAAADRMAAIAANVPGVTRATAIVHGNDAVIGIDTTNVTKGRPAIERQVYNAVKAAEPRYNVYVTTDSTLHQRIRTLNDQMRTGHPIRTLAQDVGVIIRDIGRAVTAPFR